ncbi:hypothetical protein [Subtercola sp. Z020]|nr:hypothetical protein [Subtercola sp. Z020]
MACIGVSGEEPSTVVCRRAHDALRSHFTDAGQTAPTAIRVTVGRVG